MKPALVAVIIVALGAVAVFGVVVLPSLIGTIGGSAKESLELTNQHVWYNQSGWTEAAIVVVNNGEKDAVLRKITARSIESKWADIYYWKTDTGPISDELGIPTSELSGSTADIFVDGKQRTFQQAASAIALPVSWTVALYVKNPGNITFAYADRQMTIAVFSDTKLYSIEATIPEIPVEQTQQAGAVLSEANTRFYNIDTTKYISVTLINSGTADAKITKVYLGTSAANLADYTASVTFSPITNIAKANGGSLNATWYYTWTSGQRYYFKFILENGQQLPFDRVAP
jgi:hypothetical protein